MNLNYISDGKYKTINQVLNEEFHISSRLKNKLISNNFVYLNGCKVDTRTTLNISDSIEIILDYEEDNSNIIPYNLNLDIVYEDEYLLIINKPAGIAIHPSILHYSDSLSNAVKFYFDKIYLKKKIRPVNRLDFNTSGLVVFAKNEYIQECLIKQMNNNSFEKQYICIVTEILENKKGTINAPISRTKDSIIKREVNDNGKQSITHYEVKNEQNNLSLIMCKLETGRTHQIRVHFSYIGHPLLR